MEGLEACRSAPHFKRLTHFALAPIQLVNLGVDLMDASDRSGPRRVFELLAEKTALLAGNDDPIAQFQSDSLASETSRGKLS